jgi:hypothetical protein
MPAAIFRLKRAADPGGVNTAVYHFTIDRRKSEWDKAAVPPLAAQAAGLLSLVLWFSVVAVGRIFAYHL